MKEILVVAVILTALYFLKPLLRFSKPRQSRKVSQPSRKTAEETLSVATKHLRKLHHPVTYMVLLVALLDLIIWATNNEFWNFYWKLQAKFWVSNIVAVIALSCLFIKERDSKGEPTSKASRAGIWIAKILGVAYVVLVLQTVQNYMNSEINTPPEQVRREAKFAVSAKDLGDISPREKLRYISGCETGDGTPGSGRHVDENNDVVVNENDPEDPTNIDVGINQINLKYQAKLIDELKLNPYDHDENDKIAIEIIERYGLSPWNATRSCWEPKLLKLANAEKKFAGELVIAEFDIPKGDWSESVVNPHIVGTQARWRRTKSTMSDKCEVRFDEDNSKVHPLKSSHPDENPDTWQFRCEEEGVRIKLRLIPAD